MATAAQIIANQKNAQSSTGPRTPQGKASSAANAVSHGLAGGFRVLPQESQQEFDRLLSEYREQFHAANVHEEFLVEEMAQARWRIARCRRLETEVVRALSGDDESANPDRALADALISRGPDAFQTLQRYMAAAERSYYRAHKELLESHQRDSERVWEQIRAIGSRPKSRTVPNEPNFSEIGAGSQPGSQPALTSQPAAGGVIPSVRTAHDARG